MNDKSTVNQYKQCVVHLYICTYTGIIAGLFCNKYCIRYQKICVLRPVLFLNFKLYYTQLTENNIVTSIFLYQYRKYTFLAT